MIRVSLHCFDSDPALPQRDGVNLAHAEINRLLGSQQPHPGLDVGFHDFPRLLRDEDYAARTLAPVDCVVCNVGPHAHYYHALRDRLGLGFRIVRDIKTALWSGYLLQESLCEPFLRPGDALLATSEYSRALSLQLFPHLRAEFIHLFEPVLAADAPALAAGQRRPEGVVTLGHLGRLSEDKNFPQKVDLLLELNRTEPGRYRLLAVGAVHSPSCDPAAVARQVQAQTGRDDLFSYQPPVEHDRVFALMRQLDYFLFFSTSNLEVLGRVLVEAGHAGTAVLASRHAAAPELLPEAALLEVRYRAGEPFYSHFDRPLGEVDIEAAAAVIREGRRPLALPAPAINRRASLFAAIAGEPPVLPRRTLDSAPAAFIERLRWEGLPRYATPAQATPVIAELQQWFNSLNAKAGPDFDSRLHELERISRFPERTQRFLASARRTRCDFTNLGGIDIELCNVAGYHPCFELARA
ncbi:hypothetical protein GCM10027034_24550 [Ramlibacter solisilvae]|uniref:Glycosyl transferase family 1 domain-containing protein n=1 Tax=Ramlibacter tataouinensis TaxID=94132 RepID=A0A127JQI1_9BURK|nr:glycosyltransferase [Ramlibacter tataouinensis]AMO22153.1 hypothetical protein UC35_03700 [Ramlibacter tataouinensis]